MTTDIITAGSIDQHLGPASGRFFGEGFKRVNHTISDLGIGSAEGRGTIRAKAALTYPGDWSKKSTGSLRPHVSSIDGLVLAVELAEAYLTHSYGLDLGQRRRMWLRSFEQRVAAPQEDLAQVGAQAVHTGCVSAAAGSRRDHVSTFSCVIGTMRVTCTIEHDIASETAAPGRYGSATEILGDASRRHYGDGYKRRKQHIADVVPAADGQLVEAAITVSDPQPSANDGFAGAYEPSVSMVDGLLSLAQLAQVLAYRIDGIEREASNTFWMRRLVMSSTAPVNPLDDRFDAALAVPRGRLLEMGSGFWRVLELSGHFGAMQVQSSVAHALPGNSTSLHAAA